MSEYAIGDRVVIPDDNREGGGAFSVWVVLGTGSSNGEPIALLGGAYNFVTEDHVNAANRVVPIAKLLSVPSQEAEVTHERK